MFPYIETIRIIDGDLKNLQYHQARFERTRSRELGLKTHPELSHVIQMPAGLDRGILKCRVVFGKEIKRIEFEPHKPLQVTSLQMVYSNAISYEFKYADRKELEFLYQKKGNCDDILIIKNSCITDSFSANTAFWNGDDWFTPDTPLLQGTMRASLIEKEVLKETRITTDDLGKYRKIQLINALNPLDKEAGVPIDSIQN